MLQSISTALPYGAPEPLPETGDHISHGSSYGNQLKRNLLVRSKHKKFHELGKAVLSLREGLDLFG